MKAKYLPQHSGKPAEDGFTLLETVIAAVVAMIIFFGLAQIYTQGRTQMSFDQHHRQAAAIAQAHLDGIRRDNLFDDLMNSGSGGGGGGEDDDEDDDKDHDHGNDGDTGGNDIVYTVDGVDYSVTELVAVGEPETHAATVEVTVTWTDSFRGTDIARTLNCATILGRGMK